MRLLVTGCAGFIGFHVTRRLLDAGDDVVGLDNLNAYYPPALKRARLARLAGERRFDFHEADLIDRDRVAVPADGADAIVHLAAQAGVRYGLDEPFAYQRSNLEGHLSVLEAARRCATPPRVIWASSSSVYGGNAKVPFSEDDRVDDPVSLYAATKRAGELMAHSYRGLFGLDIVALRLFTVYGPWGRPDMAYWRFTEAIEDGRPIELFGPLDAGRDMTFIDDVVDGIVACIRRPVPHETINLGNSEPVALERLVDLVERATGKHAQRIRRPAQPGDVPITFADIRRARETLGYDPKVKAEEGIARFVEWYRRYRERGP